MANLVANRMGSSSEVLRLFGFVDEVEEEKPDPSYDDYLSFQSDRDRFLDDLFEDDLFEDDLFDRELYGDDPYGDDAYYDPY
jgi:hypothetical protein